MSVGAQICKARKSKGLTQRDLAKKIGQGQAALARWELDKIEPTGKNLTKLAEALDVSLSYFFEGEFSPNEVEVPPKASEPRSDGVARDGDIIMIGLAPGEGKVKKNESVVVKDEFFLPEFRAGDRVVWSYEEAPYDGAFVVVKLKNGRYTFGQLKQQAGGKRQIWTLSEQNKKQLQGDIIAVVVDRHTAYRRK